MGGTCRKCTHRLHGAACPWHPHAEEVKAALDQHLRPTMPVCLKGGKWLDVCSVTVPPGTDHVRIHATLRDSDTEMVLEEEDLLRAQKVGWQPIAVLQQPVLPSSGHGEEFATFRSRCFASESPGSGRKAVILDSRMRSCNAMLANGWAVTDVLIVEQDPLTALYQLALGGRVVCGRLESVLHSPPLHPSWLKQHVEETVAVYVDLCGDSEGKQWGTSLQAALSCLPKLEMYMLARNFDSVGRVPCLPNFVEIDSYCGYGARVECWTYHHRGSRELEPLTERLQDVRRVYGQQYRKMALRQWQCKVCFRVDAAQEERPDRCFHCHSLGSLSLRRWCMFCKTRRNPGSLKPVPEGAGLFCCDSCWHCFRYLGM